MSPVPVALLVQLIPMIPQAINTMLNMYEAIKSDATLTPEEKKMVLDKLSAELRSVNARVQAVVLPTQG